MYIWLFNKSSSFGNFDKHFGVKWQSGNDFIEIQKSDMLLEQFGADSCQVSRIHILHTILCMVLKRCNVYALGYGNEIVV